MENFFFEAKTSKIDKKIFADPQAEAHKKQRQKRSERKPLSHLAYSSRLRSFVKVKTVVQGAVGIGVKACCSKFLD
ncbi:hypothetical protein SJ552_13225 [Enterococcus faecium]